MRQGLTLRRLTFFLPFFKCYKIMRWRSWQGPCTRSRRPSFACSVIRPACGSSSCCARASAQSGALQSELELDSGGTSQHLAALRRIGVVTSRRDGTSVYYRVEDEGVFDLLAAGRAIIGRRLTDRAVSPARAQVRLTRCDSGRRPWRSSASAAPSALRRRRSGPDCGPGDWCRLAVGVAGFWALAAGTRRLGRIHQRVRPALWRGWVERPLHWDARPGRGAGAGVSRRAISSRTRGTHRCVLDGCVPAHPGRGALRAGSDHVARGLGADDAAPSRRHPRRAR